MSDLFNVASFEIMFKKHYKFLVVLAWQITKDEDVAKDIVQDFFIDFWNRRKDIVIQQTFLAFATRAVKNLSLSYLKKQPISVQIDDQTQIADFQTDYLEEVDALQLKERTDEKVLDLVNLLPVERRKIFLQYVVEGLSYQDIANQNNISINTVKTQMKRAYAFLKSRAAEDPLTIIFIGIILRKNNF